MIRFGRQLFRCAFFLIKRTHRSSYSPTGRSYICDDYTDSRIKSRRQKYVRRIRLVLRAFLTTRNTRGVFVRACVREHQVSEWTIYVYRIAYKADDERIDEKARLFRFRAFRARTRSLSATTMIIIIITRAVRRRGAEKISRAPSLDDRSRRRCRLYAARGPPERCWIARPRSVFNDSSVRSVRRSRTRRRPPVQLAGNRR